LPLELRSLEIFSKTIDGFEASFRLMKIYYSNSYWRMEQNMISRSGLLLSGASALGLILFNVAATAANTSASCQSLAQLALPGAIVTSAQSVNAGEFVAPETHLSKIAAMPGMSVVGHAKNQPNVPFCRVAATLKPSSDSDIKMEVWFPLSGWNGKMVTIGNFGWAGEIMYGSMTGPLAEGYAVTNTDTGHDSSKPGQEGGAFVTGHPEKLIDYSHRAYHLTTVNAKTIIKAFYGDEPLQSYWVGCSLGGLEGLTEAKRYPDDYDGIAVGAPPNPLVGFNAAQLWPSSVINGDTAKIISKDKLKMVNAAVIKACATPVGEKHGLVEEPDSCGFEPKQLLCKDAETDACLTAAQVDTLEKIQQGPINPRTGEIIFPGPAKGSEAELSAFANGKPFKNALDLFRYVAFEDTAWDGTKVDWDRDINAAFDKIGPLLAVDSNLGPYFDRGGKLMLYVGWNDFHNPAELANYYENLLRNSGANASQSVKLFTIPGMGHCLGGVGTDTFNKLGTLDSWVNSGAAPAQIVTSKIENGAVVRTRPICAYPKVARYQGNGSMEDASNFACVEK
jgi:feruloyl esterase